MVPVPPASIGELLLTMRRADEAMEYLQRSLAICQDNDLGYGEGVTPASIGDGYRALGRAVGATQAWEEAHRILASLGARETAQVLARLTAGPRTADS